MALIPAPAVLLEGIGFRSGGFVPRDSNVGFDPASTGSTFLWMGVDSTSLGETGSKSSLRREHRLKSYRITDLRRIAKIRRASILWSFKENK